MTGSPDDIRFRRIVVALDTSPEGRALLELAADLATCFRSSLAGLYVEDEDVQAFADLPVGQEISFAGGRLSDLTPERLKSHFSHQAALMRKTLEKVAAARQVEHTFELRRGRPERELHAAVEGTDLLAFGRALGAMSRPRGDDLVHRLSTSMARGLLISPGPVRAAGEGPVGGIFSGTPASERAIRMASDIAHRLRRRMLVAVAPQDGDPRALRDRLAGIAADGNTTAIVLHVGQDRTLAQCFQSERPGLVVLSADQAIGGELQWDDWTASPLLIVGNRDVISED